MRQCTEIFQNVPSHIEFTNKSVTYPRGVQNSLSYSQFSPENKTTRITKQQNF